MAFLHCQSTGSTHNNTNEKALNNAPTTVTATSILKGSKKGFSFLLFLQRVMMTVVMVASFIFFLFFSFVSSSFSQRSS